MTIFEALREDHMIQRKLLEALLDTSGESELRRTLYQDLKQQLEDHATAEERYFYVPLIELDSTAEIARHGVAEHHVIDELIEDLDEIDMSSPAWMAKLKKLNETVNHHLDDEEHGFFQIAGRHLSEKEKEKLANEYQEEMRAA